MALGSFGNAFLIRNTSLALMLGMMVAGDALPQAAPTNAVTIEWDANHEKIVVGYLVYVGTHSGVYRETFDVSNQTTFTYRNVLEGRRYYFAVAAYAEGPLVGPRSEEVSTVAGPSSASTALPSTSGSSSTSLTLQRGTRRLRATGLGLVTALTALGDSRLFVIENGTHVRVVASAGVVDDAALRAADVGTRFTDVVVDPDFDRTRFVFVGVTELQPDGTLQFSIVRYRDVENTLGEGAAIVSGLSLYGSDVPRFTVDDTGRIYVALPAAGRTRFDPYAGRILRFNGNGSVPTDGRGASPVLALGYAVPAALEWDRGELWIAGADSRWPHTFARLALDSSTEGPWPKSPVEAQIIQSPTSTIALPVLALDVGRSPLSDAAGLLALIDSTNRLYRMTLDDRDGAGRLQAIDLADDETPVAVAVGPRQEIYVALRSADGSYAVVGIRD